MPTLRLFGPAREAAGVERATFVAQNVEELLVHAGAQFGADFLRVLERSQVWVNGESAERGRRLSESDEVAVLPPVSGG